MASDRTVDVFLDENLRRDAVSGKHNLFGHLQHAFDRRGWSVSFKKDTPENRSSSIRDHRYSIFHMGHPTHDRALMIRRAHAYPFWRIESSGHWREWSVTQRPYAPDLIDGDKAKNFVRRWWRTKIGEFAEAQLEPGYILIALQGKLTRRRSFQCMSPVDMVRAVALSRPKQRCVFTLHPGEDYSIEEMDAIDALQSLPNVELIKSEMHGLLAKAAMVVTQNSTVALHGYFHKKPAVFFGDCDFHHIGQIAQPGTVSKSLDRAEFANPDYEKFLYWFFRDNMINGGSPIVERQIIRRVRRLGWPI